MTFKQMMLLISTHIAWQLYGTISVVRPHSPIFMGLGLLIGFLTYIFYAAEFNKEKPNDETEA